MENAALLVDRVSKHFGGVRALTDIHLEFGKGEIVGLVGSNGAGKSTLLNVIWGAFAPDSGSLFVDGEEVRRITPEKAHNRGISIIFQHRRLMPYMTIAENIFIDKMPKKAGMIDYRKMHKDAMELLEMLDLDIDSRRLVAELTAEEKQLVEIVKACSRAPKILLMDEPTTALRQHEVETLFGIMRNLKAKGCSVVFISHRLKEVMEICDRIAIIRDGRNVIDGPKKQFTAESIVDYMSGKGHQPDRKKQGAASADTTSTRAPQSGELLSVRDLGMPNVHGVSFAIHQGEVLGLAGLGGSGIDDVFDALFGVQKIRAGQIEIDGEKTKFRNPRQAIGHGIGFVPEDRQLYGEFLELTVRDNICIPKGQRSLAFSTIKRKDETLASEGYVHSLAIKTESVQTPIKNLSGGNQQKAVIAKWLHADSRVVLLSEPTAGIDVAAKAEVNQFIKEIASEGKGILYTSSYISELMEVADRIIVIYRGELFREFSRDEYNHNSIYLAINGIDE
ncbi:MAG: sugar ABC transporter ATP-binding protein [Pirellulaceae bacterium]|nr:sugar ABC transporter ATP-binding protein [Pirellulaceae bacterium]